MEKTISKQDEKEKLAKTLFHCAIVFRSSLKNFEEIKEYLLNFTDAELTFQKISTEYLWITAPPKEETRKNEG